MEGVVDRAVSGGTPSFDAAATGGAWYDMWVTVADAEVAMRIEAEWRSEGMPEELEDEGMPEELEDGLVMIQADAADMPLYSR